MLLWKHTQQKSNFTSTFEVHMDYKWRTESNDSHKIETWRCIKSPELLLKDWTKINNSCMRPKWNQENTNDADCWADLRGDDDEADDEELSGGQSPDRVRILCLPRTTSEILLSKTSVVAGTFCQHNTQSEYNALLNYQQKHNHANIMNNMQICTKSQLYYTLYDMKKEFKVNLKADSMSA